MEMIREFGNPFPSMIKSLPFPIMGWFYEWWVGTCHESSSRETLKHWLSSGWKPWRGRKGWSSKDRQQSSHEVPSDNCMRKTFSNGSKHIQYRKGEANKLVKICTESNKASVWKSNECETAKLGLKIHRFMPKKMKVCGGRGEWKMMERAEGHNLAIIRKHLSTPMWEQVMWSEKGLLWHSLY